MPSPQACQGVRVPEEGVHRGPITRVQWAKQGTALQAPRGGTEAKAQGAERELELGPTHPQASSLGAVWGSQRTRDPQGVAGRG